MPIHSADHNALTELFHKIENQNLWRGCQYGADTDLEF